MKIKEMSDSEDSKFTLEMSNAERLYFNYLSRKQEDPAYLERKKKQIEERIESFNKRFGNSPL